MFLLWSLIFIFCCFFFFFFFFNDTATTEIYTLSLHDALPILLSPSTVAASARRDRALAATVEGERVRSEEHTSELQSLAYIVCRLLLEKTNASLNTVSPIKITNKIKRFSNCLKV